MKHLTNSEQQTLKLGEQLAKTLTGGQVVALSGDLGAGKTVFTKGLARGLGLKKSITSPTFILMNLYPIKDGPVKKFVHIDCYRLKHSSDLENIGALEYFNQPDTVVVIEWANNVKKILPKNRINIAIKIKDANNREITID